MFFAGPGGMPPGFAFPAGPEMPGGPNGRPPGSDAGASPPGEAADGLPQPEKEAVDAARLYILLELENDASEADVKKAYRKMAMKHHPDKGGDPEVFKDMTFAYDVLIDPERRQRYDRYGEKGLEKGPGAQGPQDIFEAMFGGKGGKGRGKGAKQRTKDIVRHLWVTLEELYTGVTRPVPIARKVVDVDGVTPQQCEKCGGQGAVIQVIQMGPMIQHVQQRCPDCEGTGSSCQMKVAREVLDVFVEKGSPDGHKVVFHGKADERPGCEPGNLCIVLRQQDHPRFLRRGADLYLEHEVSLCEALTGFRITVKHLDGRKLVAQSPPGEVLQPMQGGLSLKGVPNAGMPIHNDPFAFGNLFLSLSIRFPRTIEPQVAVQVRALLEPREVAAADEAEGVKENGAANEEEEEVQVSPTGKLLRRKSSLGEWIEEVFVENIDPLESSKKPNRGNQAYEEEEDGQMGEGVQCQQQ